MMKKTTPILLLTGYLGSGKTTLVNHILTNERGIKFAVIVNDIGEVNIDASLIERGGVVDSKDDSLVALSNGCICCTLKMDLIKQIEDIMAMKRFDYIVIEASGICEPAPIAQTICSIPQLGETATIYGIPRLDCIVTVVDALRLQDEFGCGDSLKKENLDEEDIENLIIQQIEFCNIILLNKVSEVKPEELARIRAIVRAIQPKAEIIECDYADVDITRLVNTSLLISTPWHHQPRGCSRLIVTTMRLRRRNASIIITTIITMSVMTIAMSMSTTDTIMMNITMSMAKAALADTATITIITMARVRPRSMA